MGLLTEENVAGPFAIVMVFGHLQRREKVAWVFHSDGPVRFAPRNLSETMDAATLAEEAFLVALRATRSGQGRQAAWDIVLAASLYFFAFLASFGGGVSGAVSSLGRRNLASLPIFGFPGRRFGHSDRGRARWRRSGTRETGMRAPAGATISRSPSLDDSRS